MRPALLVRLSVRLPLVALVLVSSSALAQPTLDGRVNRLEQEMTAVQRKVSRGERAASSSLA